MAAEQNGLQRQVFISHTGQDELGRIFAANVLKPALDAAGLTTYIDHKNLELGCDWPAELVKAAPTSAVFVVVLTQSYATRFWCLRELDLALHGHPDYPTGGAKPYIIPVYLQHPSSLQRLSTEQLQQKVQQRMDRLRSQESAERQELQRLSAERMLANIDALEDNHQGVRRQRQDLLSQPSVPEQQQQQPPSTAGGGGDHRHVAAAAAAATSRGPRVPAKDEELQMARNVVAAALKQLPLLADISHNLVGYDQQLAELTAQFVVDEPGMLGLWLYGPGELKHGWM